MSTTCKALRTRQIPVSTRETVTISEYIEHGLRSVYVELEKDGETTLIDDACGMTKSYADLVYNLPKLVGVEDWLKSDRADGSWGKVLMRR